jgi:hypothetical protein
MGGSLNKARGGLTEQEMRSLASELIEVFADL